MKRRCKECRLHLWYCPHCRGEYCYMVFCECNTFALHRTMCAWFRQACKKDIAIYHARAGRLSDGTQTSYRGPKFGSGGA